MVYWDHIHSNWPQVALMPQTSFDWRVCGLWIVFNFYWIRDCRSTVLYSFCIPVMHFTILQLSANDFFFYSLSFIWKKKSTRRNNPLWFIPSNGQLRLLHFVDKFQMPTISWCMCRHEACFFFVSSQLYSYIQCTSGIKQWKLSCKWILFSVVMLMCCFCLLVACLWWDIEMIMTYVAFISQNWMPIFNAKEYWWC